MEIGFIGLGHMGNPMVKNLLKAGFTVKVFDVDEASIKNLVTAGAQGAKSVAEVAQNVDVIFTMLQTGQQVKHVCCDNGIFQYAKKEALYIDSSSIEITCTRELHAEAKNNGLSMLDAPVSGGVAGAEAATLTLMVGGSETNFQRAKPILEKLGKKIVHVGAEGHGQAAKICNNLILGISMIAASEGFALGKKLGLNPEKFFEICSNSSSQCWSITSYCPIPGLVEKSPSNHDYKAGFAAKMMLKDLRLGQHAAESVNGVIPLAAEAAELYSLFVNQGHAEMDFSGIIKMFL